VLFLPANLDVILSFQISLDAQPVPAVINNLPPLLHRQALYLPDLSIVGVDVPELHLKCGMLLDKDNRLYVAILNGVVLADVEHGRYNEDCRD
jgi:hypothetical protein